MPTYTVVLLRSGSSAPLRHTQVEAKSLLDGKSLGVQVTNDQGSTTFSSLPEEARFEARMGGDPPIMQVVNSGAGASGIYHMDFAVDAAYTGGEGASVVLATGNSVRIFSTIQGAFTAASIENDDVSIYISEGDYQENVVLSSFSAGNDLFVWGEGTNKVLWGDDTVGHALEIDGPGQSTDYWFSNITFRGGPLVDHLSVQITAPTTNVEAHFENCIFVEQMGGEYNNSVFIDCDFKKGFQALSGSIPGADDVDFIGCTFRGQSLFERTTNGLRFTNCRWPGVSDFIRVFVINFSDCHFVNCHMGITQKLWFHSTGNASFFNLSFTDCEFPQPSAASGAVLWFDSVSSNTAISFTGCNFQRGAGNTAPYIRSDDVSTEVSVVGCFLEDGDTVIPISGIFVNSVFGPNMPGNFLLELDSGSSNVLYVGTGTVSGTDALTALAPLPQRGAGPPLHVAPEGTNYWDTTSDDLSVSLGGGAWQIVGGATGVGSPLHTIISHTDFAPVSMSDGSLVRHDGVDFQELPIVAGRRYLGAVTGQPIWTNVIAPNSYRYPSPSPLLEIISGAITVTKSHHTIDVEGLVDATDDLEIINGLTANQIYILRPVDGVRTIVFKHNAVGGNILCIGNADVSLAEAHDWVLVFSATGAQAFVFAAGAGTGGSGANTIGRTYYPFGAEPVSGQEKPE